MEAYLRAKVVSVLADYTCYHHIGREDGGNAGFGTIDPVAYFGNLREAIDIVERLTEPGPLRDLVLRRWYSVEMLGRVGGRRASSPYPDEYRQVHGWGGPRAGARALHHPGRLGRAGAAPGDAIGAPCGRAA